MLGTIIKSTYQDKNTLYVLGICFVIFVLVVVGLSVGIVLAQQNKLGPFVGSGTSGTGLDGVKIQGLYQFWNGGCIPDFLEMLTPENIGLNSNVNTAIINAGFETFIPGDDLIVASRVLTIGDPELSSIFGTIIDEFSPGDPDDIIISFNVQSGYTLIQVFTGISGISGISTGLLDNNGETFNIFASEQFLTNIGITSNDDIPICGRNIPTTLCTTETLLSSGFCKFWQGLCVPDPIDAVPAPVTAAVLAAAQLEDSGATSDVGTDSNVVFSIVLTEEQINNILTVIATEYPNATTTFLNPATPPLYPDITQITVMLTTDGVTMDMSLFLNFHLFEGSWKSVGYQGPGIITTIYTAPINLSNQGLLSLTDLPICAGGIYPEVPSIDFCNPVGSSGFCEFWDSTTCTPIEIYGFPSLDITAAVASEALSIDGSATVNSNDIAFTFMLNDTQLNSLFSVIATEYPNMDADPLGTADPNQILIEVQDDTSVMILYIHAQKNLDWKLVDPLSDAPHMSFYATPTYLANEGLTSSDKILECAGGAATNAPTTSPTAAP